jgi:hypothetical protein
MTAMYVRWTHNDRDETGSLDAKHLVANRAEKGGNDTRVGSDADKGRGVLGEELVHKESQAERLLLR